jgi:hypothetical protein
MGAGFVGDSFVAWNGSKQGYVLGLALGLALEDSLKASPKG